MKYFDLEQYASNLIYDLLDYAINGTKATTTEPAIYKLYSETVTEVFNYANNTQTSKVNILSPELSTVCLIMFAINKTVIKTVNMNKNALTADPKILGLLSEQFGFDQLDVFGLDSQREVLNRIGDLYQRKGTNDKISEILQQLKLNNTKVYEYFVMKDNVFPYDLKLVALDKYGNEERRISYIDTTTEDNNWFLTDQEVEDILLENNYIVKSPYFSVESELIYSNDNPANFSSAIISSLIRRDLLIRSSLPLNYPSIRIINDPKTGHQISFIENFYVICKIFQLVNGHSHIPVVNLYNLYGYTSTYFTDPNAALADVFAPDTGLIDQLQADFDSIASQTNDVLERRAILNLTASLFYESKFITIPNSNDPAYDADNKLFSINTPFALAIDYIIANPGPETPESLLIHYTQLISSYLSVAYRNSNVTPIFNIDNLTDAMLDLIEFVSPVYTTFIGATTILTFKAFPQDCVPLTQGTIDGNDPSGVSLIEFEIDEDVIIEENPIIIITWDVTDDVIIIDDGFELEYSIGMTFEVPLEELVTMLIVWDVEDRYVKPITYDIWDLEYDDFPRFNVRNGLLDKPEWMIEFEETNTQEYQEGFEIIDGLDGIGPVLVPFHYV